MSSQLVMSAMSVVEFASGLSLGLLFWKRRLHHRFRAMGIYLALRVISMPALLTALYVSVATMGPRYYFAYFFLYWPVYIRQCDSADAGLH